MQDRKSIIEIFSMKIIWILICFFPILTTHAQKIPFSNFTIQNGLPQNTVNAICQDSQGYIWFATQVGAARYDGYEFEYFNTSTGLPDNFVNCMLASSDGHVWFGTEGGISDYNGSDFTNYTAEEGLVSNRIDNLIEDKQGNIWVASVYGLSVITPDTIVSYSKGEALTDNSIKDILVDSKGRVLVATYPFPGLTVFEDPFTYHKSEEKEVIWDMIEDQCGAIWYATQGNGIRVTAGDDSRWLGYRDGLTDEDVLSLKQDQQGRVWCSTYLEGLFLYENGRFNRISLNRYLEPVATEIIEDRNHRIWIRTTENGIWMYDDGDFKHLSTLNGLVHDIGTDIMEDKFGNIWMATVSGASKYGRVIFEITDEEQGLPENHVTALHMDSRGRLWCGTYFHLLYIQHGVTYILDEKNGFPREHTPLSFAEDASRNIYIGTDRGLLYHNGRSIQPVTFRGETTEDLQFFSLLHMDDGKLWCGTDSGIFILEGGRVTIPEGIRNIADYRVNDLELVGDRIFCATEGGISVFDREGQHLAKYTVADSLPSNVCLDLISDTEDNVWVATDRGLSMIPAGDAPRIVKYGIGDGIASNTTYFVEFTDSTSLWIGTERGIRRLDTRNGRSKYYGYDDGFLPLETNARAVARGTGKDLWIGTVAGLVHYLPKYDVIDPIPPDLILYPPVVDGQVYSAGPDSREINPSFPYNKNSLVFNFTGIHTTIPTQNRFSFILEGYDDDWSVPGTERTAAYKKIPNGSYIFKVKAFNLDGVATEKVAGFAFSIKPPFWKTFWFIIIEVLAGLSLIYGTIKYRERQLIREKRVLEAKVKERTREIEDQKVEIEAQRDEIAEQKTYVEDQRDRIALQNKEITDSIHYAKRIQQAVLPGKIALEKTLPDHFILFRPRDIVSGDFYWVEQKNERIIICAADCTGHGVPGAFMSLLGLTFLNEIVNKDEILKASEILNSLRSYIIHAMSHKDTQARDGMDLALVVIDKQLNMLEYAGAYNPLVIIREGEMIEYKADKMPIGKHEGEEGSFTNHKVQLRDRDMIYLFSDGFPDQFGGEKGSKYKALPFKRFLQSISGESIDKQAELLESELTTWMGENDQVDDILVMGIRYNQVQNPKQAIQ
jgi:ligand-binding sensor domain-containing protein/serine phosphatase RsbU (regulator of sigma subunit)